jgi:NAD(P)-dependent dehydrogenase (short-subunit alcohol dehydrogenase family)
MVDYHMSQLDDPGAFQARIERLHPLGLGETQHIAAGFLFLASDEARWITGIALPIDGGLTCGLVAD